MLTKAIEIIHDLLACAELNQDQMEDDTVATCDDAKVFLAQAKNFLTEFTQQIDALRKGMLSGINDADAAPAPDRCLQVPEQPKCQACDRVIIDKSQMALCLECHRQRLHENILKEPLPKGHQEGVFYRSKLLKKIAYLHQQVVYFSNRSGEGLTGCMVDSGLVDWIDNALSQGISESPLERSQSHGQSDPS